MNLGKQFVNKMTISTKKWKPIITTSIIIINQKFQS